MDTGEKDRKCVSVGDGTAKRGEEIERGIALVKKIRVLLRNKSRRPRVSKSNVPISDLNESSIPDTGVSSKIVSVSVGDSTARREEEIERGIALLKTRALLRYKSTRTIASKSDLKFEAVVTISDLNELLVTDTGVPSEIECCFPSKKRPKRLLSGVAKKAKYNNIIGDETVSTQNVSDTAVTCNGTFELSLEEYDAGVEGTRPEPALAAEGAVVVVVCDDTFELSYEENDAGEEGPISEQEDAPAEATSKNAVHMRHLSIENLSAFFNGQKSNDSDAVALPKGEVESTTSKRSRVSTNLDEKEEEQRACEIKSQLAATMHPKNDAEESINSEPKSTGTATTDALTPLNTFEVIQDVASKMLNSQVTSTSPILTASRQAFESVQDKIYCRGLHANEFCGQLELMGRLVCIFTDTLFDEKSIGSIHRLDKNAVPANDNKKEIVNENSILHENYDHLKQGTLNFEQLSYQLGEPKDVASKGKFRLWKRLKMRTNRANYKRSKYRVEKLSSETRMAANEESAEGEPQDVVPRRKFGRIRKNKSGEKGFKNLSTATNKAVDLMIAEKNVTGGNAETNGSSEREMHAVQKFDFVTEPLNPKKTKPDARPLRVWQVNVHSSKSFWESELMQMLEKAVAPKIDDGSYQSSLGYINVGPPDWGSAISELDDDGTIVGIFAADNDDTLCVPMFVRGQGARPDMTGESKNTEDLSQTDNESVSPKLGQVVQVVVGDFIKTHKTTPVWKVAVDPKTGCAYYYDRLTRETTWSTPPDFVNK